MKSVSILYCCKLTTEDARLHANVPEQPAAVVSSITMGTNFKFVEVVTRLMGGRKCTEVSGDILS